MHQISGDTVEMLLNLCFLGPIVYLGLLMAIDPVRILRILEDLSAGLIRFKGSLKGAQWRHPFWGLNPFQDSPGIRAFIRAFGLMLAIIGLLHIAGLVS